VLSGVPIRQQYAVTGSVNQKGEVQAIGGVNEKIEGFYDLCRVKGLTGAQGVVIPASNVKNLMLREDVVEAVKDGRFHVYPVENIDEGIEVLTGLPAGKLDEKGRYPENTINYKVQEKLDKMAKRLSKIKDDEE
jgi:predicted ATP-dependent protease